VPSGAEIERKHMPRVSLTGKLIGWFAEAAGGG
jgi:hypothetical protein